MLLTGAGSDGIMLIVYIVFFAAIMYFLVFRPQKKEQKRVSAMLASLEVGDVVVTNITDEDVIVEFGSNRNCRIPMKKTAIQEVEKQN